MSAVLELLMNAYKMGIVLTHQNGQVNIKMPWPVVSIPDSVKPVLAELKARKEVILVHFASIDTKPDIQLQLAALNCLGIQLVPDQELGIRVLYNPRPGQDEKATAKLLDRLLRNHWQLVVTYLSVQNQPPAPG